MADAVRSARRGRGTARAVSVSPCAAADVPISIESTRHHSTRASRSTDEAVGHQRQSPGHDGGRIGLHQRIGLGDEAGAVMGRVPDHRLGVDGEPRLPRGGEQVRRVQVTVEQDGVRTGVGPVAHRLERPSGQARVGPRRVPRGDPRPRRPRCAAPTPGWGDPRAAVRRGVGRRSPRPRARPRAGRARRRGGDRDGSTRSAGRAGADRRRTSGRRRHRPTPRAPRPPGPTRGVGAGA